MSTLEIKTQAQADAARKFLDSVDTLSSTLFEPDRVRVKLQSLAQEVHAALLAWHLKKQKPRRPIQFQYEVHRVGVEYSFRAGFDDTGFIEAHEYAEYLTALNGVTYEVREVRS